MSTESTRVRIGLSRTSTGSWSGDCTIETTFPSGDETNIDASVSNLQKQVSQLADWVREQAVHRTKAEKG